VSRASLCALVRAVETHGWIVTEYTDAADESAVYVRPLSDYARCWQTEPEAVRVPVVAVESMYGRKQAATLDYLREHGATSAIQIARALWQHGGLQATRVRLCTMVARGMLVRVEGLYRVA